VRAKDVIDAATPSATSQAAASLARLAMATGDQDTFAIAERLVALGAPLVERDPTAAATLVAASVLLDEGVEVAVPGPAGPLLAAARRAAPSFGVLAYGDGELMLLEGRARDQCYVCRRGVCDAPVSSPGSVAAALTKATRWEDG
jgi:uncharacterized protein YyaL (SSP411 family)